MRHAIVLGAGGIGSNVRKVWKRMFSGEVITIDDDTVEASNLNRSDFTINDVGNFKANRCYRISSREEFFEKSPDFLRDLFECEGGSLGRIQRDLETYGEDEWTYLRENEYVTVIDCRDTIDPKCIFKEIDFKLTYNGAFGVRFEVNPFHSNDSVFGETLEAVRYGTTPSFCIPPLYLVAMMVDFYSRYSNFVKDKNNHRIIACNIEERILAGIKEVK